MVAPFLPDAEKIAAVRDALPATGAGIYLDTATAGPIPREAALAMAELAEWEVRTGRVDPAFRDEAAIRADEARATYAAVLGTDTDAVALTHGRSHGLNVAAWSMDWPAGHRAGERAAGRAVATSLEGAEVVAPLWALRDRLGVELAIAQVGDGTDDDATLAALDEAIVPGTRLVAVSHVTEDAGVVLPIARIAELAHARGALLAVDGSQAAGALPVDVQAIGADFYVVPASTWLLGPTGMGALACSELALHRGRPAAVSAVSFARFDGTDGHGTPFDPASPDGRLRTDARRFETSDFHQPSIVGMARAASWLAMYVGLPWIHERTAVQARRAHDLLAAIPGVSILTPTAAMAGIVTFRIRHWPAPAALEELGHRVYALAGSVERLDAIRISPAFFTTDDELSTFCDAVELLARHTPASLPPRRTLRMLGDPAS